MDWFKIGKGEGQGFVFSPCLWPSLVNLHADDVTLMIETEEALNSLLMKVKKESEKVGLKLNF